jgi:carboxypeptidase family protein
MRYALISISITLSLTAPVRLLAQTVELRLRNDSTRTFVAGAIVRLLGAAGVADQGLTDELGRLTLRAASAGNYRLRIDRIGFAALLTESFDLASGETLAKEIEVSSHAQQLPPIEVVGKSQCSGAGMAGTPAGILWEEIQKALTANLITIRRAAVPLHVRDFTREVGTNRKVARQWFTRSAVVRDQPFASVSPSLLMKLGFVRQLGDSVSYAAPDAALLLSDEFTATHCFYVVPGSGQLTGLAFQPLRDRLVTDVRGVLWVDRPSSELRFLEYGYTGLTGLEDADVGGRVEFARLPSGAWIVSYWQVRMPLLEDPRSWPWKLHLLGYRDRGGRAELTRDPEAVEERAVVRGTVRDGTTGGGLAGAVVRVVGQADFARTDAAGAYRLAVAGSGDQWVTVSHPKLGLLRDSTSRMALLSAGDSVTVDFATPPLDAFVRSFCRSRESGLLGLARGPDGRPATGIEVRATWPGQSKQAKTGPRGLFALCGLPAGQTMAVRFSSGTTTIAEQTLALGRREYRWIDIP